MINGYQVDADGVVTMRVHIRDGTTNAWIALEFEMSPEFVRLMADESWDTIRNNNTIAWQEPIDTIPPLPPKRKLRLVTDPDGVQRAVIIQEHTP